MVKIFLKLILIVNYYYIKIIYIIMFVYHQADLDRTSQFNKVHTERYSDNPHDIGRIGNSKPVIPIYKYESIGNPSLQKMKRGADARHRVLEDRRQKQFNHNHSPFYMERPLN
jgi:hypothetical protein